MSLESQQGGDTGVDEAELDGQLADDGGDDDVGESGGSPSGADDSGEPDGDSDSGDDSGDDADGEPSLEDLLDEESMAKKVKIKVNGEEKVMTVADAIKVKQLEDASHQRMREAAETKKMARKLFDLAKNDPERFLKLTGQDPDEFAQAKMAKKLEMMGMSEEQREALQLKQENEQLKARQQAWEQRQQQERINQETEKEYQKLQEEVDSAWKDSGLPTGDNFRSSIAQVMLVDRQAKFQEAQEQGLDPSQLPAESFLTAKDAAEIVKKNWTQSVQQTFSKMDPDGILEMFDKDTLNALKKALVKRASDKTSPKYKTGPGKQTPASGKSHEKKPLSDREYREWQEKLMSGQL